MVLPLFSIMAWAVVTAVGVMVLPVVLGWLPAITDFVVNFILWLVWVLRYRNNK